jgi:predicted peroxiredoxin
MSAKKVGFIATHAQDDPEKATLPFMLAVGAMTMAADPVIVLQGEGVRLGVKGYGETIAAEGMPALEGLLAAVLASGHKVMVCSPCMTKRGISEDDLREGCFVGGAPKVIEAMLECENMLTY